MAAISFKTSDGTNYKFADFSQLAQFVDKEISEWAWLNAHTNTQPGHQLYQTIVAPLLPAQNFLRDPNPSSEVAAGIAASVQTYFNIQPPVHAKAPLRNFLQQRAAVDALEALYFLGYLFQKLAGWGRFPDNHSGHSSYVSGVALATGYLEGWKESDKALAAASSANGSATEAADALANARSSQAAAQEVAVSMNDLSEAQRVTFAHLQSQLREENDALRVELNDAVSAAKTGLNADWKALTATYDAQLALKAPATYWASKKRSHSKWVAGLATGAFIAAGGGAFALFKLATVIFGSLQIGTLPTWIQAISFSLGGIVYLWTLRSILRFLLSHAHLALDAAERQTMIVSYLALIRKQGVKTDSLDQLFAAIFRPSGDGIVKEEGIPLPGLLELLAKR
ncbi:MAG: DUF6161 domain-containing protein [Polaromonas sp.]|uniref:DUF6161 domain-containing protein n=1 Tax=Polaromonas sp. TaxID=1869339 RepID=UPI0040364F94